MIKTDSSISLTNNNSTFLPRDAMRKRGLCCRPVSVRVSRWWIVSKRLKIPSNFLFILVAQSL